MSDKRPAPRLDRSTSVAISVGLAIGLVIGGGSAAAIAATGYGAWQNKSANGVVYQARNYITDVTPGYAGTHVKRQDGTTVTVGKLGGIAKLARSGTICATTGLTYNSTAVVQHIVKVAKKSSCPADNYDSVGYAGVYITATGNYEYWFPVDSPLLYIP